MSKFIDRITEELTANVAAGDYFDNRLSANIAEDADPMALTMDHQREIVISVEWHIKGFIKDNEPYLRQEFYKNAIFQLTRDVYGEFDNRLLAIERAIYGGDRDAAMVHLRDMRTIIGFRR